MEADGIRLEFNNRKILSDVYLKCETGIITGLLGRNGEGKSSLLKVIYGTFDCEKSVRFDGIACFNAFKRPELLRYLPQFNFIPAKLSLKRIFNDFELDYSAFVKQFPEFAANYKSAINNLSGGARRLVEIYTIVKVKSQFAMLDEPFTHLSPIQIDKVKEFLLEEKMNKGLFITDHLYKHIIHICDNLIVLREGKTYHIKRIEEIEMLGYTKN